MSFQRFNIFKTLALLTLFVLVDGAHFQENVTGSTAVEESLIGGSCTASSDCPANAGCRNGRVCICSPGYIQSASMSKCLKSEVALGNECEESQQCQVGSTIELSYTCTDGRCDCTSDAIAAQVGGIVACYQVATDTYYQARCEAHEQCAVNLGPSFCLGGNCVCFRGYEPLQNRTRCVLKVEP